jgi:two-component system LytT family response regulator
MNDRLWDERRMRRGDMTVSFDGRRLALLWTAVFVLSVIYCELSSTVFGGYAVTLQVSAIWALQTWLGWMALSLFARRGARWAMNTPAALRTRLACVMTGVVLGLAGLDTMGSWLLANLRLIEPIDVMGQLYLRGPRFLVGGVLIAAALEYLRWRNAARSVAAVPEQVPASNAAPACPVIKVATRGGEVQLTLDSIESFESAGNYVQIHLPDGKSFLHRATLKEMEVVAKASGWQRVHRTAIVNPMYVKARVNGDGLRLSSGRVVRIGRVYKKALDTQAAERG